MNFLRELIDKDSKLKMNFLRELIDEVVEEETATVCARTFLKLKQLNDLNEGPLSGFHGLEAAEVCKEASHELKELYDLKRKFTDRLILHEAEILQLNLRAAVSVVFGVFEHLVDRYVMNDISELSSSGFQRSQPPPASPTNVWQGSQPSKSSKSTQTDNCMPENRQPYFRSGCEWFNRVGSTSRKSTQTGNYVPKISQPHFRKEVWGKSGRVGGMFRGGYQRRRVAPGNVTNIAQVRCRLCKELGHYASSC